MGGAGCSKLKGVGKVRAQRLASCTRPRLLCRGWPRSAALTRAVYESISRLAAAMADSSWSTSSDSCGGFCVCLALVKLQALCRSHQQWY